MKNKGKEKGFTLIELLIVIAILAILAAIVIPAYVGYQDHKRNVVETNNLKPAN